MQINTVSDPLALAATSYSALEINYLKIIVSPLGSSSSPRAPSSRAHRFALHSC